VVNKGSFFARRNLTQLINSLKERNNDAYHFFENERDLTTGTTRELGLKRLATCFAIAQYADLTFEEEQLLSETLDDLK
jgi:hypothetical protein